MHNALPYFESEAFAPLSVLHASYRVRNANEYNKASDAPSNGRDPSEDPPPL